jgi:LPXTG-site transpeptidase (sortase) family protein
MLLIRGSKRLVNAGVVFIFVLGLVLPMRMAMAMDPVCIVGGDCYGTIQAAVNAASPGSTINVAAGTYDEDVNLNKSLALLGAGADEAIIRGVFGGDSATVRVAANSVTIAGFTITRLGNNVTDWNNPGLNSTGIGIQGALTGMVVHDNILTGNRTGIDINNSSGHTVRNNLITDNRTGMILRNQTNNLTVTENRITDNWTVGIVFLDASGGTNNPLQTALNCSFSNNNISGNWYGQVVDRQTGGSLPLPGSNLKNFSGNWFGTAAPVLATTNSAEPGYADLIPVEFGGTATPPAGQADLLGPASANIDFTPHLNSGMDTNVETTSGRGTFSFQGDFSALNVSAASPQSGSTGRIQEAINLLIGSTINVSAGVYTENITINKALDLLGAQANIAAEGRTASSAGESTIQGLLTVTASDVEVNGFSLKNPGQTNAIYVKNHSPSYSNIVITNNIVEDIGNTALTSNVHAVLINQGPDSVTITHNRFSDIKTGTRSVSAVGVLDSASADPSTNLLIQDNVFTDIASTARGAYGILINNAAGAPGARILDNTFSDVNGGWTHAIGLEGPTLNAMVSSNIFSDLSAASPDNAAILLEENSAGGTVTLSNNQFNGASFYGAAIHPDDLPGGSNDYSYTVDARNNWWGSTTGPTDASNAGGTGASVGPNVIFTPWCATPDCAPVTSSDTASGDNPTATTGTDGITATGTGGSGTISVAQFESNPVSADLSTGTGIYFDVYLTPGYSLTSLTVTICDLNGANNLAWWNGATWIAVTPSASAAGSGCLQFVATATSLPSLDQLTGTMFGAVKAALAPIPSTGFAPDLVTVLPPQRIPYAALGDLWLEIPKLGVQAPIVGVPQSADGTWDVSWLGNDTGWLQGSAFPTWAGNSVLTGHIYDAYGRPGPFRYVNTLWYGNQIIVHAWGGQYVYAVRSVQQVLPDEVGTMMKHETRPWLTLVTCRGYDEASDSYQYRILIRAVLIEEK